jgi:predicted solute-binding protein
LADLSLCVPSECADRLENGEADVGLVPVIEIPRLGLKTVSAVGIACRGAVRSILLVSKVPLREVRTLAADANSRSSVALARIVLERRHGARPEFRKRPPELAAMLAEADAAVLIGDPALRVSPATAGHRVFDLGQEWFELTGLPMVFATWAARRGVDTSGLEEAFLASWRHGMTHLDDIVAAESAARRLPRELVRNYLTHRIVFEIGEAERSGMALYLDYARRSGILESSGAFSA